MTGSCRSFLNGKILRSFGKDAMTRMILIDLQKAFNAIDREILLKNVYNIGSGVILSFGKYGKQWKCVKFDFHCKGNTLKNN